MAVIPRLFKVAACLMILLHVAWCYPEKISESRLSRRLVWPDLTNLIKRCTGRCSLNYLGYGCYCGKGGSGTPVDNTDMCCQIHDACYTSTSCIVTHLTPYSYGCGSGCNCWCNDKVGSCPYEACQCDVQLAKCLSKAKYSPAHKGFCPNSTTTSTTTTTTTGTTSETTPDELTTTSTTTTTEGTTSVDTSEGITELFTTPGDFSTQTTTPFDVSTLITTPGDVSTLTITPGDVSTVITTPGEVSPLTTTPDDVSTLTTTPDDGSTLTTTPDDGSTLTTTPDDVSSTTRIPSSDTTTTTGFISDEDVDVFDVPEDFCSVD